MGRSPGGALRGVGTVGISDWTIGVLALVVVVNTLFIAGLAGMLFLINKKVDEALERSAPILQKTTETLGRVEEATAQLQQKVDHVLDRVTSLVDTVSERVDTTTAIAEE